MQISLMAMDHWSGQQQDIFDWFKSGNGNLLVRARAGTGKTTTILKAIEYAPDEKILLAAFNKRVAEELNQRLKNRKASAKTLHSIGYACVNKRWHGVQVDQSGDRADKLVGKAIEELAGELFPETTKQVEVSMAVLRLASKIFTSTREIAPFARNVDDVSDVMYTLDQLPELYMEDQGWTVDVLAQVTLRAMELALVKDTHIDFADMIYIPLRNDWVKGIFDMVVIDEAQDMNDGQLELAERVCKIGGRIVVVGDDRQAIYAFRGADANSIDRLKAKLRAWELSLTTTYRCPQQIVDYAACLVPDIKAKPGAPQGTISSIPSTELASVVKPGDFVLSRSNAALVKACLALLRVNIRAQIVGRDIGQRLANIAKKLNARDLIHFHSRLKDWANKEIDRAKKADRKARIQLVMDQAETLKTLAMGISRIEQLYERIDQLFGDPSATFVICSTVHRAKGSETDRVYVLQDTLYTMGKTLEEENIEYVAVTRTKDKLIWVNGFNPRKKKPETKPGHKEFDYRFDLDDDMN